jgi:biopolymer transport protein ExbD
MGAKLGSSGGPMADINVTPLIDVVLVLLVVFMVITPMLTSGLTLDLPQSTVHETVEDMGGFVVVSVAEDGRLAVGSETFDEPMQVISAVQAELSAKPEISENSVKTGIPGIIVKGDQSMEYQKMREILDLLAENNINFVGLATNKET